MNENAWLMSESPDEMLAMLRENASLRKLRLFMTAACRRLLPLLANDQCRAALGVIDRYADKSATAAELSEAGENAENAFQEVRNRAFASAVGEEMALRALHNPGGLFGLVDDQTAQETHRRVDDDALVLATSAVWTATFRDEELEAASAIDFAAAVARQASHAVNQRALEECDQCRILRDIFGNPFRHVSDETCSLLWKDADVIMIANSIYYDRAFNKMIALADAIQSAGCNDAAILGHFRTSHEHVRGCWVVDLILDLK